MRMDSEFFALMIAADLAAELMGLHGELPVHVDRLQCAQHNLIKIT